MKRLFRIISVCCCMAVLSSCIDEDFNLSDIDTDDITIGNNESEFLMPLASVCITTKDLYQSIGENEVSIKQLYDEVSVWFPSTMPDNADYVDIPRLMSDEQYTRKIFDALYNELLNDSNKRTSVCEYVVKKHRQQLIDLLLKDSNPIVKVMAQELNRFSDGEAVHFLSGVIVTYAELIKSMLYSLATSDIDCLNLHDVDVDIPSLDISHDIEEMLSANLDPASDVNPINAIYIYGHVESDFPFRFLLTPMIENTMIIFGEMSIDKGKTDINEIRIYKEDIQTLFNGSHFNMPITVERYYPYVGYDDMSQITLHLYVRKTGGLKI